MDNAIVIVVGDIGHSPRMCYHSMSLASKNVNVELVGYDQSKVHGNIRNNDKIKIVPLAPVPNVITSLPTLLALPCKGLWISFVLFFTLIFYTKRSVSLVLIQNPPGLPALLFSFCAAWLKGAHFVIDWHNYTSSILRYNFHLQSGGTKTLKRKCMRLFVDFAEWFEKKFGQYATWNLCVSNSMRDDLKNRLGIRAITHYDRPPSWNFRHLNVDEKHRFFMRLTVHPDFANVIAVNSELPGELESTIFSYRDTDGVAHLREKRPIILMSSTSWTEDEDFNIMADALKKFDTAATPKRQVRQLPDMIVVITGKGPMKSAFLDRIHARKWTHVTVITPWLTAEDYPKMLACADLGVSLHVSTSGLDLPMKVVDMLGCRVPVLAKKFLTIGELINENNGRLFDTADDLNKEICAVTAGFPKNSDILNKLKLQLQREAPVSWESQWEATFWPLLKASIINQISEMNEKEQRRQRAR